MAFDYNSRLINVLNVLVDNNTTTSAVDISNGLYTRINSDDIIAIDPELTVPRADRLPAIYVTIVSKDEEFAGLGATGIQKSPKLSTVYYNVLGIIGKYGAYEGQSTTLKDVYIIAHNIERVFQKEYKLSNTAMWCNPVSTEFSAPVKLGEGFAKAVLVRLQARYMFT